MFLNIKCRTTNKRGDKMNVYKLEVNRLDIATYQDFFNEDYQRVAVVTDSLNTALISSHIWNVSIMDSFSENFIGLLKGSEEDALKKILSSRLIGRLDLPSRTSEGDFCSRLSLSVLVNAVRVLKRWELEHPEGREVSIFDLDSFLNGEAVACEILEQFSKLNPASHERLSENKAIYMWFKNDYYCGKQGERGAPKTYEYTGGLRSDIKLFASFLDERSNHMPDNSERSNKTVMLLNDEKPRFYKETLVCALIESYIENSLFEESKLLVLDVDTNILDAIDFEELFKDSEGDLLLIHTNWATNPILSIAKPWEPKSNQPINIKDSFKKAKATYLRGVAIRREDELRLKRERAEIKLKKEKEETEQEQKRIEEERIKKEGKLKALMEKLEAIKSQNPCENELFIKNITQLFPYQDYAINEHELAVRMNVNLEDGVLALLKLEALNICYKGRIDGNLALSPNKTKNKLEELRKSSKREMLEIEREIKFLNSPSRDIELDFELEFYLQPDDF